VTPTHPDLEPDQIDRARRALDLPERGPDGGNNTPPAPAPPPWRARLRQGTRKALRPVYARLADGVAERILVANPVGRDVHRVEDALTRVEAELELLRGQVAAQEHLIGQLRAELGGPKRTA
jgi:hypothetical protein